MATIEIKNLSKSFQQPLTIFKKHTAGEKKPKGQINDLNLTVENGKTMVILGPSGCGKTTILRLVSGLIPPDRGEITFDGVPINEIPMRERRIGMVFQNYALYPNFNVKKNMLTWFLFKKGQKNLEMDEEAREKLEKTARLLDVSIEHLYDRMPRQLSGGEKQRVALGRCITRTPALFLMDEPFSNLDQILRQKYRDHLKQLLHEFGITTIYVTHDQHEAILLADKIAVMNYGSIEQCGTFEELYSNPTSLFVASFLNPLQNVQSVNTIPGEKLPAPDSNVILGFRPQHMEISADMNSLPYSASVLAADISPFTGDTVYTLDYNGENITAVISGESRFTKGDDISFDVSSPLYFDSKTGKSVTRK